LIYSSNLASVLPQLNLDDDVIYDIQTAVAYGKQVTVSKSNINFNGWTGCGYIIFDPVTGGGAYLISGGLNGVWVHVFNSCLEKMMLLMYIPIVKIATALFCALAATLAVLIDFFLHTVI